MLSKRSRSMLWIATAIITILFGLKCLLATEITYSDEMYYIAGALRFYKGDAMLVDDWAPMQLNGFLLMPLVGVYYNIFGSMEGIVFCFRLIYLLIKLLVSIFAIHRLWNNGENKIISLVGVAFFYFSSPYNIDALSYNTIPIIMLFLIMVIVLTHRRDNDIDWFLCGIFLAISILGHPFIVLVYIVGSLMLCLCMMIGKVKKSSIDKEFYKLWFYVTCGSAIVALIFAMFIFSRASLTEIIDNLYYIFQEPDHDSGILQNLFNFVKDFFVGYKFITVTNIVCIVIQLMDKKKRFSRLVSFGGLCVSCVYLFYIRNPFIENLIYIPFAWFSVEQILYYENKKKNIFVYVMIFVAILGVAMGTNTRILSTSAAMCNFASLSCFVIAGSDRSKNKEQVLKGGSVIVLMIILASTLIMRLFIVWQSWFKVQEFQYYIDRGPLKGMYTKEEIWKDYYTVIHDLDTIDCEEGDIFLCGTYTPLAYLYMNLEYGTMGVAFFFLDYDRLDAYWEMHPEKQADIIYYPERTYSDEEDKFIENLYDNYEVQIVGNRLIAERKR